MQETVATSKAQIFCKIITQNVHQSTQIGLFYGDCKGKSHTVTTGKMQCVSFVYLIVGASAHNTGTLNLFLHTVYILQQR